MRLYVNGLAKNRTGNHTGYLAGFLFLLIVMIIYMPKGVISIPDVIRRKRNTKKATVEMAVAETGGANDE